MPSTGHLERVAIIGAGGHVGRPITEELLKSGRHTVTAITRTGSTSSLPDGVKRVQVDYDDKSSLVAALKGQQFLIISLSVAAPPDTHSKIVDAASEAAVPYIMPNVYGGDIWNEGLQREDLYSNTALKHCLEVQEKPNTSYIAMCCGFWFEWSLAHGESFFGIDIKNKTATFFDDGKTPVTASTWRQCGRAAAGLLALPESVIAEKFKNAPLWIASFTVTQRNMLDSIHRVQGTTDADWAIRYQDSKQRYQEGLEEMKAGNRLGFAKAMYTRCFFPNGGGDFESARGLHNGLIGLEKEDLDEAVKRAVHLVEFGWTPGRGYDTTVATN